MSLKKPFLSSQARVDRAREPGGGGGKTERADRVVFSQRGFLSISARLSKQEEEAGPVRAPGAAPGCGRSDVGGGRNR